VFPLKRALKARIKEAFTSIPHVTFVEFDAAFAQKLAILLLKTMGAMVLFLTLHVFENGIKLTWAKSSSPFRPSQLGKEFGEES